MAKEKNREKALAALLTTSTITDAARVAGLSHRTLTRYLEGDEFKREYRAARASIVENAVSGLQSAASEAVETLKRNLHCENPAVEVRCAQIIIENSIKGVEVTDLMERLERLENDNQNKTNEA